MILKAIKNSLKKIVRKNIFVKKKKFYDKNKSTKKTNATLSLFYRLSCDYANNELRMLKPWSKSLSIYMHEIFQDVPISTWNHFV